MKRIYTLLLIIIIVATACKEDYRAAKQLPAERQQQYLVKVAPYVNKRPKKADFDDRFLTENRAYYEMLMKETQARFDYFLETDTAKYFFYTLKDLTSLYEHYRAHGGYFKVDENDSIVYLNIFFYTPRLTKEEMEVRGEELFREMIKKGSITKFVGNRDYIHVPNADFEYSTKENRWVYTENSSWKFLEEAKESATLTDSTEQK